VIDDADHAQQIETARRQLAAGKSIDDVLVDLRASGLWFIPCIKVVRELTGVSLGQAKDIVHNSEAFAVDRHDREEFWSELVTALEQDTTP
jgi:ribosomal protein L7/L12